MTTIVPAIGTTCLGIVIGWLVRYFIRRFKKFSPSILSSVITIILGGAALKFLSVDKSTLWFYPIGLLIGFVVYQVIVMFLFPRSGGGSGSAAKPPGNPFSDNDPRCY
jgi:glycopeptide antibiotics resistance protein